MDKKAKERVAIAKDAMEWVKAGALRPERMVYGESPIHRKWLATHGFSSSQLRLIEEAFEIWGDNAASAFGRRYADSKSRMLAILQNIIDNNGTFVP